MMEIKKVWAVYFSPAGTTGKIVETIAGKLAACLNCEMEVYDYTLPDKREKTLSFEKDEIVVFGTCVYAGRIPNKTVDYVQTIKGNGTYIIPAAVYGNRSFQDSLSEMKGIFENNGFIPAAAAAFTSRHAMSKILGAGRPSKEDMRKAEEFAENIAQKIAEGIGGGEHLTVPGNDPVGPYYRPLEKSGEPANFLKAKPLTTGECDKCGLCAEHCPMGSISKEDPSEVTGICIKCHACVRICPKNAKYFDNESLKSHIEYLEEHFLDAENEPEFFICE